MAKQTSAEISALASKYMDYSTEDFICEMGQTAFERGQRGPMEYLTKLTADIRSLSASALSQDETPSSP